MIITTLKKQNLSWVVRVFIIALGAAITTIFLAYFAFTIFQKEPGVTHWMSGFTNWDGHRFIEIARQGYTSQDAMHRSLVGHFPFYPLLIKLGYFLFQNYSFSAVFLSNFFYFAALILFFKLACMDRDWPTALQAVFFLALFPTAFIFHTAYAESLFLALTLTSFYFARRQNFMLAGIFAMLACATRFLGIVLIPALLAEYLQQKRFKLSLVRPDIFWLALAILGPVIHAAISHKVYGSAWMYFVSQDDFWGRSFGMPWEGLSNAWAVIHGSYTTNQKIFYGYFEMGFMMFAILAACFAIRGQRLSYTVYTFALLSIISFNTRWAATPRYLLMAFPLFIFLAGTLKQRFLAAGVTILFCGFQLFFWIHFFGKPYLAF